ncbi:MAG TPA: LPS assembly lipoprotein LptE [Methylophilaceae bacterium]|nr:LPS assembly lipoprotein LptE [Methylophilaceae bacterium]
MRLYLITLLLAALSACGFHLRGPSEIPFESIFIEGNTLVISRDLKQALETSDITILQSPKDAELRLELVGEENEKRILSLAGTGTVNEYELYYRIHYRTKLVGQDTWSDVYTIESRRDYTYSDATLLAKLTEEQKLNQNMQEDVLNGLMRRLSSLKKKQ